MTKNKIGNGIGAAVASQLVNELRDKLSALVKEAMLIRRYVTARQHFVIELGGPFLKESQAEPLQLKEQIPPGYIFVGRRLVSRTPKGCKLQLFKNGTNGRLLERVAAPEEFADAIKGDLIFEGPGELVAVISGNTENGTVEITISGYLVPRVQRQPRGQF